MDQDITAGPRIALEMEISANPERTRTVARGLSAFNRRFLKEDYQPVNVYAVDETGAVRGGLIGALYWHAFSIESLWLDDELQGHGLGRQMIEMAEGVARATGCSFMHVDTMSFQARAFYEKQGFALFGTLSGYAEGYERYYMQKRFDAAVHAPTRVDATGKPTSATPDA